MSPRTRKPPWRTSFEVALVAVIILLLLNGQKTAITQGIRWRREVVYRVPTKEKVVALTFDDGPHPVYTPKILDILDKYHVHATFFMIGRDIDKYPDIVKEAVRRGNVIANHTYTHPHDIDLDPMHQVVGELQHCEDSIQRVTGQRPHLFRPPRGMVDGRVFNIAAEEGYQTILWTVSADHHDAPTPELMAERVVKHACPGMIVLAHDGYLPIRWRDVDATPLIVERLQKMGYRFVTLPELLEMREK